MSEIMAISARRVGRATRRVEIRSKLPRRVAESATRRRDSTRKIIRHGSSPPESLPSSNLRRKRLLAESVHIKLERQWGVTITIATGRVVPVRLIGEQHVVEDLGFIPSFADWVRCIRPERWMGRAQPIHAEVDPFAVEGTATIGGAKAIGDRRGLIENADAATA